MVKSDALYHLPIQYGNGMNVFRGSSLQKGYGLGGLFKGLARTFAPAIKRGLINVGKHALQTGAEALNDYSHGADFKQALQSRAGKKFKQIITGDDTIKPKATRKRVSRGKASSGATSTKHRKYIFDK